MLSTGMSEPLSFLWPAIVTITDSISKAVRHHGSFRDFLCVDLRMILGLMTEPRIYGA